MTSTQLSEEKLSDLNNGDLKTFKVIAKQRYLQMKDFSAALALENINDIGINTLKNALEKLKKADLIKEQSAPIDMFNMYYITAKGLYVDRLLRKR